MVKKSTPTTIILTIILLPFSMVASLGAETSGKGLSKWSCLTLLDKQTRADLADYESTFASLYEMPSEYEKASKSVKERLVKQWIREVRGNDYAKAKTAAAALGAVKADSAVTVLEKVVSDQRCDYSVKGHAVRSLGQIGEKRSIPILIELIDHRNRNIRVYAKVSLAEITGVYFGDDKVKWRKWLRGNRQTGRRDAGTNKEAAKKLRWAIDEKYSYRDLRRVDWDGLFKKYGPLMEQAETAEEFAETASKVLGRAEDVHIWLEVSDRVIHPFRRSVTDNYNLEVLKTLVPTWKERSNVVYTGRFDDGIGYIHISSWGRRNAEALEEAYAAIWGNSDTPGLIIDVRSNDGGSETLAERFAGRFVDKPVMYAKHVYRAASEPGGFGEVHERVLRPNMYRAKYRGHVVVLMGPVNMSSCEGFLLMMKQVPNCKLVGEKSYGSSGNPKPVELGNGVTVYLPSWKSMHTDNRSFEGEGISPDVLIKTTRGELRSRDPVLEAALKLLREPPNPDDL